MIAITGELFAADPSDPRAQSDYGAAQLGFGLTIPARRLSEKRAALERARDWLARALQDHPADPALARQLDAAGAALAALPPGSPNP